MSDIPKHEPRSKTAKKVPKRAGGDTAAPVKVVLTGPDKGYGTPSMQHDINHVAGLDGVEQSLDWIGLDSPGSLGSNQ